MATSRIRRARGATAAALVLLVVVGGALFFRIGWTRASNACTRDDVAPAGSSGAANDWSWWPPGFTCTWDDGTSRTSLWW